MIISVCWLRTSSKFSGKNAEKAVGTLDYWKILSKSGFLEPQISNRNEKCANRPKVNYRLTLSGDRRINTPQQQRIDYY